MLQAVIEKRGKRVMNDPFIYPRALLSAQGDLSGGSAKLSRSSRFGKMVTIELNLHASRHAPQPVHRV